MTAYEVKAGLAEIDEFTVGGISIVTDNEHAAEDINTLWEQFFQDQIGQSLRGKADDIIYAVYSDYEGDHTKPYRVTIGYRIAPAFLPANQEAAPSGKIHYITCQAGDYAVLSAGGQQPKALMETWEAVWAGDLDRSYGTDFELYGPRFFENGVHEVLVHVGVKV